MREKIEYYLVKFIVWVVGFLPNAIVYGFIKTITMLFYRFEKRRSSLTKRNLKLAFPEMSDEEIEKFARKAYESIAITIAEIVLMFNDKLDMDSMVVNLDEFREKLKEYTKDKQKGLIVVTAHFSNWEFAAQMLPKNGYPMVAIGKRGQNGLIEDNFTTPFRNRNGNRNVHKKQAMVSMVKALRANENVGLLIDQKAGGVTSAETLFFGEKVGTTTSVATMKLKYDSIVLPIFFARQEDGKYKALVYEPVNYVASETDDKKEKIQKMTQKYNDIFEEVIKEYPEQWFWMHNRWSLAK